MEGSMNEKLLRIRTTKGIDEEVTLKDRIWIKTKKMWIVAGPAIFMRFSTAGVTVISLAFIGHIGSTELAAYALVSTVWLRFANGILEIYSIKLPGDPKLGEGKPENQNHAIVFTRGEAVQTIDINQIKKFKDASAKHSPDRCSLGKPKGLEEKELVVLAANKDLSFTYTLKPEQPIASPKEGEILTEPALTSQTLTYPPLPLPLPLQLKTDDAKDKTLVSS